MSNDIMTDSKNIERINWNFLQEVSEDKSVLQSVLKFHYSTMNRIMGGIENIELKPSLLAWLDTVVSKDILPKAYEEAVNLTVNIHDQNHSAHSFNLTESLDLETVGQLLFDAFGRETSSFSKRYPSAGALYPVIPLLLVLSPTAIKGISTPGCYVFDSTCPQLLRISTWDNEQIKNVEKFLSRDKGFLSHCCIAYAIDIKRAITKYRNKGYRHALIEIGLMAQCFRESLLREDYMGERCWSGFQDMSLTHICGLNIRLSPIALIQWFGLLD